MVRVNTWEGLSPKQLRNTYAETALAVEPPDEGWDCLDLVGVKGTADRMLRLGDTFSQGFLWSRNGNKYVLRMMTNRASEDEQYKTVSLAELKRMERNGQNWCGPVVGEL